MDKLRDQFHHGRRDMLEAFLQMSTLARQAGVNPDAVSEAHGRFFNGNVEIKNAFRVIILLAEVTHRPGS